MSKEAFTNRHGVTTLVDESSGEMQPVAAEVQLQPKKAVKKSQKLRKQVEKPVEPILNPKPKRPFPWRFVRVMAFICVAIAVMFVFGAQVNSSQYQSAQDNMKKAVTKARSEKFITEKDLASVVSTLQKDLPAISCPKQSFPIQFTKEAKDAIANCQLSQESYDGIRHNLDTLASISSYGTNISAAMKPALTNAADGTFASIDDSVANWQAASAKIATVSPPKELQDAHKAVVGATKNVASAWQKLQEADASRDSAAYDAAKTEISNAYESFRGISGQYLTDSLPIQKQLLSHINSFK